MEEKSNISRSEFFLLCYAQWKYLDLWSPYWPYVFLFCSIWCSCWLVAWNTDLYGFPDIVLIIFLPSLQFILIKCFNELLFLCLRWKYWSLLDTIRDLFFPLLVWCTVLFHTILMLMEHSLIFLVSLFTYSF